MSKFLAADVFYKGVGDDGSSVDKKAMAEMLGKWKAENK